MAAPIPLGRYVPLVAAAVVFAAGFTVGARWRGPDAPRVFAATATSSEHFAVCTAPLGDGVEGLFLLDFETGDLSGGVLDRATAKFTTAYRSNVLKDLEFKAGTVRNPRFLLTAGLAGFGGNSATALAPSVIYVTDATTGVTVAYGIPWNARQAGGPMAGEFVPLDIARPRGGRLP